MAGCCLAYCGKQARQKMGSIPPLWEASYSSTLARTSNQGTCAEVRVEAFLEKPHWCPKAPNYQGNDNLWC